MVVRKAQVLFVPFFKNQTNTFKCCLHPFLDLRLVMSLPLPWFSHLSNGRGKGKLQEG